MLSGCLVCRREIAEDETAVIPTTVSVNVVDQSCAYLGTASISAKFATARDCFHLHLRSAPSLPFLERTKPSPLHVGQESTTPSLMPQLGTIARMKSACSIWNEKLPKQMYVGACKSVSQHPQSYITSFRHPSFFLRPWPASAVFGLR